MLVPSMSSKLNKEKKMEIRTMKSVLVFSVVALSILMASGCESMWNRANKGFLERDLRMLLDEKCRVRIAEVDCRMLGTTRNAVGVFEASQEQINAMIKGLKLKEAIAGSEEEAYLEKILSGSSHKNLRELQPFSGEGVQRYCSKRRADELVLGNGISFEYFVLFVDPSMENVCVLISYAYG
jgi:hypothetical protein